MRTFSNVLLAGALLLGGAGHVSGLTAVGRTHCRHTRSRRSSPPLRPHRHIAVAQRRSQLQPGHNHLCVEHFCVAVRCYGGSHPRTPRLRARRGRITGLWMGLDMRPYRLLDSHNWRIPTVTDVILRYKLLQSTGTNSHMDAAQIRPPDCYSRNVVGKFYGLQKVGAVGSLLAGVGGFNHSRPDVRDVRCLRSRRRTACRLLR